MNVTLPTGTAHRPWQQWPRPVIAGISLIGIALIGLADYLLPPVYSLSLVYLLPVAIAAWFAGFGMGALASLASTIAVVFSYTNAAYPAIHVTHWVWLSGLHAAFMFIFAFLLDRLRARTITLALVHAENERALLRTRAAADMEIRVAKERLELATSAGNIGVWSLDFATGKLDWDDRLWTWYQAPAEMRESGIPEEFWLSRLHPDDRERVYRLSRETPSSGAPRTTDSGVILADGSLRYIHSAWTVECDPTGQPTRLTGINRDVTSEHEQSEALRAAMLAADCANNAKSAFLASVSHEIRTPMNAVLGIAQVLAMEDVTPTERVENAQIILRSGRDLLALINHLLDLAKIESGKLTLEELTFAPRSILDDVETLCRSRASGKDLLLRTRWSGDRNKRYRGDPFRLRQMLTNLVDNAIKFTIQGSVLIEASELEPIDDGAMLEFSVTDTGIGVPPERQHLLFQPFSQTEQATTREYGGTGLGLSIVQSLARLMRGSAGVESRPGQGSRFWFRARVSRAEPATESEPAPMPATPARGSGAAPTLSGRVLVVEDHALNREVITGMLTRLGLEVSKAADGLEAVTAILGGDRPDLVLMDIHMPVLDGHAATSRIREWEQETGQPHLPIIALTADAYEANRRHCLALGMDEFIVKPIDFNALATVLEPWLGSGRQGQSAAGSRAQEAPGAPAEAHPKATLTETPRPLFDEASMLGRLDGDRELAAEIAAMALDLIPPDFDKLEAALIAADLPTAKRSAHTLKGLVAQVGGANLAYTLQQADTRLARGETIEVSAIMAWRDEFERLVAILRERNYLPTGPFDA